MNPPGRFVLLPDGLTSQAWSVVSAWAGDEARCPRSDCESTVAPWLSSLLKSARSLVPTHAKLTRSLVGLPTRSDKPLIGRCFRGPLTAQSSLFRPPKWLISHCISTSYRAPVAQVFITLHDRAEHGHATFARSTRVLPGNPLDLFTLPVRFQKPAKPFDHSVFSSSQSWNILRHRARQAIDLPRSGFAIFHDLSGTAAASKRYLPTRQTALKAYTSVLH